MGCDIHMRVEVRKANGWEMVGPIFTSWWREETPEPWEGRNYDLFAMLADVRNGYGFAGVPTGLGFKPISDPRGIPTDASAKGEEFMNSYDIDGHSHSYHTLRQLREYDWDGQTTGSCGVVPADEFERLRDSSEPPGTYSGGVSGPGIVTFTEEGYDRWVAEGRPDPGLGELRQSYTPDTLGVIERPIHVAEEVKPYVRMTWFETYREAAGPNWFSTLEQLTDLVPDAGTDEDVRIIFFFDN